MALTKAQVLAKRQDLSQFLFHLTRTGIVKYRKDIFSSLKEDQRDYKVAKERLERILTSKVLRAISPFGYFQYKVPIPRPSGGMTNPNSKVQRQWLKSVCFTETPLDHIQVQMQSIQGRSLHFEPYGLAFTEDFIRRKGGSPVMYFDSGNQGIVSSLDSMATSQDADKLKSTMSLYEGFGKRLYGSGSDVDFRWEREWRSNSDIEFTYQDVAFGVCKTDDISYFSNLVGNAFPFIDPVGDLQHIQNMKIHLRTFKHLQNLK